MLGSQRRAGRSSANRRPPQSRPEQQDFVDLPPYEPPKCPPSDECQRQLKELSTSRINERYEKQTAESAKLLSGSVFAINERVTNRKQAAAQLRERAAKRKNTGDDGDGDAGGAETAIQELEEGVSGLRTLIEEAMREVIDMQASLEDDKSIFRDLPDLVASRQQVVIEQARQHREADDEEHDLLEVPGVPIFDIYREAIAAKAADYDKLTPYQKYAVNNAYIDFKKSWHDGLYPDEGEGEVPLPDATKWFDRDGRPRHETRKDEQRSGPEGGEEDGEEDDDIQIASEKRSFRCPLSLTLMKEPYTCKLCRHSFEKSSIVEYIKGANGRRLVAKCPVAGCHVETMSLEDLYLDEALLRRIKRAAQAEKDAEERSSNQEDEDGEAE